MEPHIMQSGNFLNKMVDAGGMVFESALPMDDLVMFRLTDKEFIKPGFDADEGMVYCITKKGMEEAERVTKLRSH